MLSGGDEAGSKAFLFPIPHWSSFFKCIYSSCSKSEDFTLIIWASLSFRMPGDTELVLSHGKRLLDLSTLGLH